MSAAIRALMPRSLHRDGLSALRSDLAFMNSMTDWDSWHADYRDPSSLRSEPLRLVHRHTANWLDASAPTPVTVLRVGRRAASGSRGREGWDYVGTPGS